MATANLPSAFFSDNFSVGRGTWIRFSTRLWAERRITPMSFRVPKEGRGESGRGAGQKLFAWTRQWSRRAGAGGGQAGYAYTDDITIKNLELAARTAQYIAQNRSSQAPVLMGQPRAEAHDLYAIKTPVNDIALEKKVELLYEIDKYARGLDARVKNVFVSLGAEYKVVLVASSQGLVVGDIQPLTGSTDLHRRGKGNRQIGSYGGGGRVEFGFRQSTGMTIAKRVKRRASAPKPQRGRCTRRLPWPSCSAPAGRASAA